MLCALCSSQRKKITVPVPGLAHPSLESCHLGASFAVVDAGADGNHATRGNVVCRGHLDRPRTPHAADDLDGDRAGIHALPC